MSVCQWWTFEWKNHSFPDAPAYSRWWYRESTSHAVSFLKIREEPNPSLSVILAHGHRDSNWKRRYFQRQHLLRPIWHMEVHEKLSDPSAQYAPYQDIMAFLLSVSIHSSSKLSHQMPNLASNDRSKYRPSWSSSDYFWRGERNSLSFWSKEDPHRPKNVTRETRSPWHLSKYQAVGIHYWMRCNRPSVSDSLWTSIHRILPHLHTEYVLYRHS